MLTLTCISRKRDKVGLGPAILAHKDKSQLDSEGKVRRSPTVSSSTMLVNLVTVFALLAAIVSGRPVAFSNPDPLLDCPWCEVKSFKD